MNRFGNYFPDTTYQELYQFKTPDEETFHIDFEDEQKSEVNPFDQQNFLNGGSPKCSERSLSLGVTATYVGH